MLSSFKELLVWKKSFSLAKEVYKLSEDLPKSEQFGLRNQMCRSAVSITSNIAEGYGRGSKKDYIKFLRIAYGSALELETQLLLANDLYNLKIGMAIDSLVEVQKMLHSLIKKLNPEP